MDPVMIGILVVLEAVSAAMIVTMWRHHIPENLRRDAQWTVLLLIPVFGPLIWGSFYGPLPKKGAHAPRRRGGSQAAAGHGRASAK